ncbi:hypothetical protein [Streptomyces sp. NPDC001056]
MRTTVETARGAITPAGSRTCTGAGSVPPRIQRQHRPDHLLAHERDR